MTQTPPDRERVGLIHLNGHVSGAILWAARVAGALALVVIAILLLGPGIPRSLFHDNWERGAELVALGVAAAGYALAWRSEGIGSAVMLLASAAFGVLALLVDEPGPPAVACVTFLLPGALFFLHWQQRRRPFAVAGVLAVLATIIVVGGVGAGRLYDHYLGPTHPESRTARVPVTVVRWIWSGAVTTDGFTVKARLANGGLDPVLLVSESVTLVDPVEIPAAPGPHDRGDVVEFRVTGLRPGTTYHYAVRQSEAVDHGRSGRVTTLPAGPASFTIAFGSCARTGSNGMVWDRIREANPLLMLVTGDFHYENISANDAAAIRKAYERGLAAPAQQALWLVTPIVYTWDDHDFGGNNSDRTTASREAVQRVYRDYLPHYDLPAGADAGPIYQAFTIGRVRFIVTDTRSGRDPAGNPDTPEKSMLGQAQKDWFKAELLAAKESAALIVWVNSVPWIAQPEPGADHWGNYATERRELSDFIVANGIDNLVMLSGDAHMLAADDGSNNTVASDGAGPGFPVFHAAALDRRGAVKGGPYSEGAYPGGGQFGLLTITDGGGGEVSVAFSGRNWEGTEVVAYSFTIPLNHSQ
jgi:phosphodiesterase/alkaline phosphatase D-like protein